MTDFIKLIIILFLIFWVVKFLRKHTKRKPEIDINDFIETTKLLNRNTIYAKNIYRLKDELKKETSTDQAWLSLLILKAIKFMLKDSIRTL